MVHFTCVLAYFNFFSHFWSILTHFWAFWHILDVMVHTGDCNGIVLDSKYFCIGWCALSRALAFLWVVIHFSVSFEATITTWGHTYFGEVHLLYYTLDAFSYILLGQFHGFWYILMYYIPIFGAHLEPV